MKRRIISILLSVIMVVTFLPLAVFAEENSFEFCGQTVKYSGAVLTWSGTEGESDAILTFTNTEENGSLTLSADVTAWILAVGGGGGGGGSYKLGFTNNYGGGGGGGAGGFIDKSLAFEAASYTITVGAGGAGGTKSTSAKGDCSGGDGEATVIFKGNDAFVTALGGGGGGSQSAGHTSESGQVGSGGGGSMKSSGAVANAGGKGTAGQGKDGGAGDKGMYGGGGGGAGAAGADASTENPVGGDGLKSNITGTEKWYAGGGGGSHSDKSITSPTAQIAGGKGGGGKGGVGKGLGTSAMSPTDGENGTGGGGGGCDANTTGTGGAGGSGIVVIRLKIEAEEIHSHGVECPDCYETVSDPALTKCPKCGADLENSAMVFTAWDKTDSLPDTAGNYYLTSDVSLSANWSIDADINLCLNGFNIIRNGGNAVTVNNGSTLSIYDCSETPHKFTDNNGLWVLDEINGTNLLTGGCIMGVNPDAGQTDGIGVFINQGGTLNLNGGNIVGNYASNGAAGVFVGGTFTMNGGSVCGNKANLNGGGVYVSGTLNLSGGSIDHNTATNNGGGVYVDTNGTVALGGTAEITGNTAGADGSKTASNLYLASGKTITLGTGTGEGGNGVAAPTGDFSVGVTMQTPGKFTTNGTEDEVKYFTSDNSAYIVSLADDESGLALVSPAVKFTKTQAQWADKVAGKWNLGIVGTFNTSDIAIDFDEKGTSTNVSAVGVIVSAGEKYEKQTTRFVYETGVENEYCYRAVIKNISYNVSSEKTITVQFFATVDGKNVLGEIKTINLADAYTTAINNGMPTYEG